MPTDAEQIAATAAAARAAQAAADGVRADVTAGFSGVKAQVEALLAAVAVLRALSPTFVRDKDDPAGAVWVVDPLGGQKRWVQNNVLLTNLLNRYPGAIEPWNGSDLDAIPTIGDEPPSG